MTYFFLHLFILLKCILSPVIATGQTSGPWCYSSPSCGPDKWPELCLTGQRQSPINLPKWPTIVQNKVESVDILLSSTYYNPSKFTLFKRKATLEVQLNATDNPIAFMNNQSYGLIGVHFHWGLVNNVGSEHRVADESFSMEMHLVHIKSDFGNDIRAAIDSKHEDAIAVIGVFFSADEFHERNDAFVPIVDAVRRLNGIKDETTQGANLVLSHLLPTLQNKKRKFMKLYRYDGSLTTPTCEQQVKWFVLRDPVPISFKQIREFRHHHDKEGSRMSNNFRPVQQLNNRTVNNYHCRFKKHSGV